MRSHSILLSILPLIVLLVSIMTSDTEAFAASNLNSNNDESAAAACRPADESHHRLSKWSKRWSENQLGWHTTAVHKSLLAFGNLIVPDFDTNDNKVCSSSKEANDRGGIRVLVPLCGKTVDMAFLAKHPQVDTVVGVDGIRKALDEFVDEQKDLEIKDVSSTISGNTKYERLEGKNIVLLKGDFFELEENATGGKFDAIWDRASIVAIEPNMREAYVGVMSRLLKPGGTMLVSTFERRTGTPEAIRKGPPFSIPEQEMRRLYEGQDWVESVKVIQEVDEFQERPESKERFLSQGVTSFYELIFEIKTNKVA